MNIIQLGLRGQHRSREGKRERCRRRIASVKKKRKACLANRNSWGVFAEALTRGRLKLTEYVITKQNSAYIEYIHQVYLLAGLLSLSIFFISQQDFYNSRYSFPPSIFNWFPCPFNYNKGRWHEVETANSLIIQIEIFQFILFCYTYFDSSIAETAK